MKKLFTLVMLFIGMNTYAAQIDSTDASTSQSLVSQSTVDDSKEFLKSVSIGAGDAMKTGYEVVVAQQRVYAVQYLMVGIFSLICFLVFIYLYVGITTEKTNRIFPAIVVFGFFLWSAIVFSQHYNEVIQGFINPDYAAIKDIVETGKQLMKK